MNVLVATNELQGIAPGDYAHTVEGELVLVEVAECADADRCGCGRGWPGMASQRATTTAMVAHLPHLTDADLRQAVRDSLHAAGWADLLGEVPTSDDGSASTIDVDEMIEAMVDEHVELIDEVCRAFPVGSVLERSGTVVRLRTWSAAA